ncbi:MAG: sulfite exporter TauE/SafE family protein [Alphaproteobacteria bacterium]|nr:sulfite exporter TauE/SafE family protein [Alphaproteobacteria bacterium]
MLLALLFFIVAAFYASVGFGGGSSYLALLVMWGLPYTAIPAMALLCNILVVSGNSIHYARAGYIDRRMLLPPTLASVPMAYIGGRLPVEKELFLLLLFATLLVAGLRLLVNYRRYDDDPGSYTPISPVWGGVIGAILGLLSGVVGIGGGIFLAPILYNLRAGAPKQIAATASLFILANSIAGLIGQLQKSGIAAEISNYWYLPLLVLAGGQLGNLLTIKWLPSRIVALLTALLVLFVAGKLGLDMFGTSAP